MLLSSTNVAFVVFQVAVIKYVNNLVQLVIMLQHIHVSYVVLFSPGAFFCFPHLSLGMRHLVCFCTAMPHCKHFYTQNGV